MKLKSQKRLYLDANATYGLLPEVTDSLTQFLENFRSKPFLNPSSIHLEGQSPRAIVDEARSQLYVQCGLQENTHRIFFTSGATEGNNHALAYPFRDLDTPDRHPRKVVTTSVEHSSVEEPMRQLEQRGVEIIRIHPEEEDTLSVDDVLAAVDEDTRLLSLIWANNETGIIHPVPEIFRRVRERYPNCLLHTDAVQMFSKCKVNLKSFPFDFLTIAPHKFGALPGIGVSIVNAQRELGALLVGGAQELKWRPGTENLLGIVSTSSALKVLPKILQSYENSIRYIRDEFEQSITERYSSISIVGGDCEERLPNTSMLYIPGVSTEDLVVALDLEGLACSRGSACSSGKQLGSHVLGGMSYPKSAATEVLRFSFRADFPKEELKTVLERLFLCLDRSGVATTVEESATLSPQ